MIIKARLDKVQKMATKIKAVFSIDLSDNDLSIEEFEGFPGYLYFAGKPITKEIEEQIKNKWLAPNDNNKSRSQVLRSKILELWYKKPELQNKYPNSEEFYEYAMNILIEKIKYSITKK
jgi:hypothetical protein